MQVAERAFHGLQIQAAYTYSHALDDSSDPLVPTIANSNHPIDSFDLRHEKGNSGYDTRHRGVINFIYQPNIGRGKATLSEGFLGHIFEGVELSGIVSFQTGLPYDIFGFMDTLHTNVPDRATLVNPSMLKKVPPEGKVISSSAVFTGFNLAAFNPDDPSVMPVPFGIPSNVNRNHWYGPGINNWNISLAKNTPLMGDKLHFQLRLESYNLFNRVQFSEAGQWHWRCAIRIFNIPGRAE